MSCRHANLHTFEILYNEGDRLEWCFECGAIRIAPDGEWQPPFTRRDTQPTLDNPTTDPPPALCPAALNDDDAACPYDGGACPVHNSEPSR